MNIKERARNVIESYGGNPDHWPEEDREAVLGAVRINPNLQQLQAEAMALDEMMGGMPDPGISERALNAVLEIPEREPRVASTGRWIDTAELFGWRPLAGLGSALAAGLVIGVFLIAPDTGAIAMDTNDIDLIDQVSATAIGVEIEEF